MDKFDFATEILIKKYYRAMQLARLGDTVSYKPIESKSENVYLEYLDLRYSTGIPVRAFHGVDLPKRYIKNLGWENDDTENPYIVFMLATFANPFNFVKESIELRESLTISEDEIVAKFPDIKTQLFIPQRGDNVLITTPGGDAGTYVVNSQKTFGINYPVLYLLNTNLKRSEDRISTEVGPLDKNADNSIPRSVGKKY